MNAKAFIIIYFNVLADTQIRRSAPCISKKKQQEIV
jgi:hypothetical protein